ncbi:APC family permease [Mariniluteicoccus endophyticus]
MKQDAAASGRKGLRAGVLGLADSLAIGVASTGPAYSMTATIGLVAAAVGFQAPAVVLLAFVPVFCAALGYHALNRAEPDCGTSFVWVARAFGPSWGWMAGWAIVVCDVLVMASLAQVAGQYTFLLLGVRSIGTDATHPAVLALGVAFIVLLTWLCVRGIGLTARLQQVLVLVETVMLVVFSVVALWRVYATPGGPLPGSTRPDWTWFDPTRVPPGQLTGGILLMVFLYWGWDSVLSVNEESRQPRRLPGLAAVWSTVVLLAVYVLFAVGAQAVAGVGTDGAGLANPEHVDDVVAALAHTVFGDSLLGRAGAALLVLMVLTSAAASTQTTLLPTARTTLSMAHHGALPEVFARVHPRHATPTVSTWAMGAVSVALYVPLNFLAEGRGIADAVSACGVAIGFYYGLTALASSALYRNHREARLSRVVLPAVGGVLLLLAAAWTAVDAWTPGADETRIAVGGLQVGGVFVFGVVGLLAGLPLMWWWRRVRPAYFTTHALARRLPETAEVDPALLDA